MKNQFWRLTLDTNPEDCNLHCIMCEEHSPYSSYKAELYRTTGIKRRVMPAEWLENIFSEANELGIQEIIPSTMGEPLLYESFDKILDLCYKYNLKLNLTTNGTFPRKKIEEWAELIIPITSDIKISWNGVNKKTTESIMLGQDYKKSLIKIKDFIKIRDNFFSEGGNYCRVSLQLTFLKKNMQELKDIIRLAAEIGVDRIKGHHLWTHFNEIKNLSFRKDINSIKQWNQYVAEAYTVQKELLKIGKKILLENIIPLEETDKEEIPENYECPFLNRELWISATGKISPCCAPDDLRQSLGDFGNIRNTTIKEVIINKKYQQLAKNYTEYQLCKTCNMRKPI